MNIKNIIHKINCDINKSAIVGFDGFIDELNYVVEKKIDDENFIKVKTISDFGKKIISSSGLSMNIEFKTFKKKLGGNGPIMASALISQNINVHYIGALGEKVIDEVFKDFKEKCVNVFSLANPGHTDALEFEDGKLMLGKMTDLKNVNWKSLITKIDLEKIVSILKNSDLIAFTNWTMIVNMDSFFKAFSKILKEINHCPFIFIDLADPSKRNSNDILQLLNEVSELQNVGKVILGLNERESEIMSNILGINEKKIKKRADKIRLALKIDIVVIHPREGAVVSYCKKNVWIDGPFCKQPLYSTGAGDNFNAGFCFGLLLGLNPEESLLTGVYTSGYYVRKGKSPDKYELVKFMKEYLK